MVRKELLVDPSLYDVYHPLAGIDEIRSYNKQRFEMEQLTAVVYENMVDIACVGYKDVTEKEFWIRGHMPEFALMPGVIMCEVAAQLASFFTTKHRILENTATLGFAGLDEVRFRGMVRPGDRLVMQVKLKPPVKKILVKAQFVGLVKDDLVCEGIVKGVPLILDKSGK
ncbi:MAG: beta-hydroxyacyl-ACP dehydratase [Planctomycetaceae bacterium]|nr:beta-hydroxyacyl-ACP dehydratase [Planctomycetaceae bacterium]